MYLERLEENIIVEIFQYVGREQLQKLRGVSRSWRTSLIPAAGMNITCRGDASDSRGLSKFLRSHGKFTRSVSVERITMLEAALLGQHCKRATSLEIRLSHNEQEEAILLLLTKLTHLNSIKVYARFEENTLEMLRPLINRVESLVLECRPQSHNSFLMGLTSPSVKAFSLLGLKIDGEALVELIRGFDSLEKFHYTPYYDMQGHFGFSYNVRQQRFDEIHLVDLFGMVVADVQFKPVAASNCRKKSRTDLHQERFSTLEKIDPYELLSKYSKILPPIKSICLEISHDPEERDELDNLNEAIQDFCEVENLAIAIKYEAEHGISMSCMDFKAKSLYFNSYSIFNGSYTLWLLHHFPLLQDIYFPINCPNDLARVDCGELKFKSLQRVFVYQEQPMGFWEKLVQMAPNLSQINISLQSPYRHKLITMFPSIFIGVYSRPDHFMTMHPKCENTDSPLALHSYDISDEGYFIEERYFL